MNTYRWLRLLCCWLWLYTSAGQALQQDNPQTAKPLNQPGVVYDISQDQQDFLWLASEYDGLLRFDGQDYLRFNPPAQLQNASFSQVATDPHNQLWLATWGKGLWRLDASRQHWQQVGGALSAQARIQTLTLGADGTVWAGSTEGLYLLRPGTLNAEAVPALAGQRIWDLVATSDTLWVATSNGLFQLTDLPNLSGHWLQNDSALQGEIRALALHQQQLLVGLKTGLALCDAQTGARLAFSNALTNSNVLQAQDDGSWLAGTINGLYQLRLVKSSQAPALQLTQLEAAMDVRALFADRQHNIWLGSRSHGLLPMPARPLAAYQPSPQDWLNPTQKHRLGPLSQTKDALWLPLEQSLLQQHQGQWRSLAFDAAAQVSYIRNVVEFAGQTLVGTDRGLFSLGTGKAEPFALQSDVGRLNIETMARAADGALWLGLWEHGVLRVPPATGSHIPAATLLLKNQLAQEGISDIRSDDQQQLWLLSRSGKLYQGEPQQLSLRWQVPASVINGYFQCLVPEADTFWLCTDRGLLKLSRDFQKLSSFGVAQGLPDNRVIGITRTARYSWVLTRHGVMAFQPDGSHLHLLADKPGLDLRGAQPRGLMPVNDPVSPDQVVLATDHGLWQLSLADLSPVPAQMQLHLTELSIARQVHAVADPTQGISLPSGFQEVQLRFKLLSYQPHLQVNYFFRWQDQPQWHALGPDGVLTLGQLAPGQHQLEVMAQAGGVQVLAKPVLLEVPVPWYLQPAGQFMLAFALFSVALLIYQYRLHRLQQRAERLDQLITQRTSELESANQQLQQLSHTDSLTGLMNRRAVQAGAQQLQAQRGRHLTPLTLVLMDIDHFKQINDRFGHDAGDAVLKAVASYLQSRLRAQDLVARWGGEEFLLLMPNTSAAQALQLIEQLRTGIHSLQISVLPTPLSATFGISPVDTQPQALEQALKAADQALYQGKRQGRDQVVLAN